MHVGDFLDLLARDRVAPEELEADVEADASYSQSCVESCDPEVVVERRQVVPQTVRDHALEVGGSSYLQ